MNTEKGATWWMLLLWPGVTECGTIAFIESIYTQAMVSSLFLSIHSYCNAE